MLHPARQSQRIREHPAGPAVKRQPDAVAGHLFHRLDAVDGVAQAPLRHLAALENAVQARTRGLSVVIARHFRAHRAVKPDRLLQHGEAFRAGEEPAHVLGVILGRVARHREADSAVVDANAVADLAAQQLVDRQVGGLARDIP